MDCKTKEIADNCERCHDCAVKITDKLNKSIAEFKAAGGVIPTFD